MRSTNGGALLLGPLLLVLLLGMGSCARPAELTFQPPEWSLGSIPSSQVARTELVLHNRGPRGVRVRFVSTCDCLVAEQAPDVLAPGAAARVTLSYDPAGQSGFVEAALIVVAGRGESRAALRVTGKVLPAGRSEE